jgi:hypothetical protein
MPKEALEAIRNFGFGSASVALATHTESVWSRWTLYACGVLSVAMAIIWLVIPSSDR